MNTLNTIETLKSKIAEIENQIETKKVEIETVQNNISSFEYSMTEDEFNEVLDYEGVVSTPVGEFYPSDILKSCDPIAYRCAKSDYEGNYDLECCVEYQELQSELERLEIGLEGLEEELDDLEEELDDLENN